VRAWHEWNKLGLPVPQCPRRELLDAPAGSDIEPTDDEYERGNGCGVLKQWDKVHTSAHKRDRVVEQCGSCPLNDGRIVRPSGLYANGMGLLNELDMGLQIKRHDVSPIVLEAAKLIRSERALLREQDREHAG